MDVDIVYIGGDLPDGRDPVVGQTYQLTLANTINTKYPIRGVQLRKEARPSGWVREHHKAAIQDLLERGGCCTCLVTSTRVFVWDGEICFWGVARWEVQFDPGEPKIKVEENIDGSDDDGVAVKAEDTGDPGVSNEKEKHEEFGGSDTE